MNTKYTTAAILFVSFFGSTALAQDVNLMASVEPRLRGNSMVKAGAFGTEAPWTVAMSHFVIEEALSGRTTSLDDPTDSRLNGSTYLPSALASHLPLDLVILMLGSNDTKAYFHRTPFEITAGMSKLAGQVLSCAGGVGTIYPAPKVLIIASPPMTSMPHAYFQSLFGGAREKSAQFGKLYGDLADFMKVHFLNDGDIISTDGVDGLYFTAENNRELGLAVAKKVQGILKS